MWRGLKSRLLRRLSGRDCIEYTGSTIGRARLICSACGVDADEAFYDKAAQLCMECTVKERDKKK